MTKRNRIISLLVALVMISVGAMTLAPETALAQSEPLWAMNFGGTNQDRARCVEQTSDGGYIVAGYTESFGAGDEDFWILKLTSNGLVTWQKVYGGSSEDFAESVQQTTDGGYIVGGYTESFGAGSRDFWVLKLSSNGNIQWQKTYGGIDSEYPYSVQQTTDGGYIVGGYTESFGAGGRDFWVLKLASNGNVQWQKTYGGSSEDIASSIQQTSDGGYIVVGWTESSGAGYVDCLVLKLASNGTIEWQKTYGDIDWDECHSIQQTSDGGYIMAGSTESFGTGDWDFWVLKLTSNGNAEWQKTYGGSTNEGAESVQQTSDGGYVVIGWTDSFGAGGDDIWLLKLASNGNAQWHKTYGDTNWDDPYSVRQTPDGGYIMAGSTQSFTIGTGFDADFWVLRVDDEGSILDCSLGMESNIRITNTQSTIADTTLTVNNTVASVSIPSYSLTDSDCSTYTQCYYSPTAPIIDEPSAENGFASIAPFLQTAYGFKAGEGTGGWTIYNPLWPAQLNTLTTLYVGRGYWVYVSDACILQFGSSVIVLDAGWNLIGWIPQL
ncbi:hypothetical protein ACFLWZ_06615 [Chloroflexota bacterium]